MGPIVRYREPGGYLRVGFIHQRVAYLEGSSPRFRAASGLGVGSNIPFGRRYGAFYWHVCGSSNTGDGYWETRGGSWQTKLYVTRGTVTLISIMRHDLPSLEC
jgi:hypothetical protein